MRILLARHGETQWNVEGRHQGQSFDIPLSAAGRVQACTMGKRLEGLTITRALASPLLRARQTAELVLGERASMLRFDENLREMNHGEWEGLLATEVRERWPEVQKAWRNTPHLVKLPGGESFQEVQNRAWAAFQSACVGLGEEDLLLLVTHDGVNRALLCRGLGLPLSQVWKFRQAATCLNLLEGDGLEHLQVVRLNDASHLTPLFGEVVHRKL